jgi:hypothetical protein
MEKNIAIKVVKNIIFMNFNKMIFAFKKIFAKIKFNIKYFFKIQHF